MAYELYGYTHTTNINVQLRTSLPRQKFPLESFHLSLPSRIYGILHSLQVNGDDDDDDDDHFIPICQFVAFYFFF